MQPVLLIENLCKAYATVQAVSDVSLEVYPGEIFGLLGPNGAGKTTTIRIVMDILRADSGEVQILGQPPGAARERVGYLPEERGLYPNMRVLDLLVYLAELKGRPRAWARERARQLLARVALADWTRAKVKELSRGMQQKVQIVASLVHDPDLLILDEPFQGLDPINVQLVKEILAELQAQGKTIVLSTHQMNQVEALCTRIALINRGHLVLYGDLREIKRRYAPNTVRLHTSAQLPPLANVARMEHRNGTYFLELMPGTDPQEVLRSLVAANIPVDMFEIGTLPLEDIFVRVVKEANDELA